MATTMEYTDMPDQLKPCPAGHEAKLHHHGGDTYGIYCEDDSCEWGMGGVGGRQIYIDAWNAPRSQEAEIERLREENNALVRKLENWGL